MPTEGPSPSPPDREQREPEERRDNRGGAEDAEQGGQPEPALRFAFSFGNDGGVRWIERILLLHRQP
jgi:hypothetical protein